MSLKNLKNNEQRLHKSLKSILCCICVFCINFTGCKPDSTPVTIQSRQESSIQTNKGLYSEDIIARQIQQLNRINTNYDEK